jgi:transcription initiation factor TFIIIB Brf1 subunit/transcription initiation factor TFIIB
MWCVEGCGWAFLVWRPPQFSYASRKRRRAAPYTSRSRRRPHGLTASLPSIGFCSAKAGSSREPLGAEAQTGAASLALYSTRLQYYLLAASRRLYRETLHGYERRLAKIGDELKRVKECAGLPQRAAEEAESFVKKYFDVVGSLPPEVAAAALLWTAAKATSAPRPLEDFLKCSRAEERRVRKAAWRLKEAVKLGRRPSIEDYVKTLAARVNLPAPVVKAAVELLERNRRVLAGKNPWVSAAALWLTSLKKLGLLKALAEAAGTTTVSIRKAAGRMKV